MAVDGLTLLRAVRDGRVAGPPMAELIGAHCTAVEPGMVEASIRHQPALENSDGFLHGGAIAVLLDATMGAAAHTLEGAGTTVFTQDLTITYLKPVRSDVMPVTGTAQVVNRGRNVSYVTGEARDRNGRLVAHAVGNFWARTTTTAPHADETIASRS